METLVAMFGLGLASAASPCLLPLYPAFLAYLTGKTTAEAETGGGQNRKISGFLGLAILAGVMTVMLAVGVIAVVLKAPLGQLLILAVPIISVVLFALGVMLLAGRNPFIKLASVRVPGMNGPISQAYVYGLFLGPIAIPCAGPFLVAGLAISVGVAGAVGTMATFLAFGLGFGMPLVLLSVLARTRQDTVVRFITRNHRPIELLSGLLLIAAGAWYLWVNWDSILLMFDL
jgi:cytochrome c-type biogenesis protein